MYTDEASAENWDMLLQYAAWVHNTTVHTVLGKSPFEILTGQPPRNISGILQPEAAKTSHDSLEVYLGMKQDRLKQLQQDAAALIEKAQAASITRRNQFARSPKFQVGDEVWVKVHSTTLINKKWNRKYDGPYVITEIISPQVVRVYFKADPKLVDLVHTTRIRKYLPRRVQVPPDTNVPFFDDKPIYLPELSDDSDVDEPELSPEVPLTSDPLPSSPHTPPTSPSNLSSSSSPFSPWQHTPPGYVSLNVPSPSDVSPAPSNRPSPSFWHRFRRTPASGTSQVFQTPPSGISTLASSSGTPPSTDSSTDGSTPAHRRRWRIPLAFRSATGSRPRSATTGSSPSSPSFPDQGTTTASSSGALAPPAQSTSQGARPVRLAKQFASDTISKTVTDWDSS
jgi:hypothetical protein